MHPQHQLMIIFLHDCRHTELPQLSYDDKPAKHGFNASCTNILRHNWTAAAAVQNAACNAPKHAYGHDGQYICASLIHNSFMLGQCFRQQAHRTCFQACRESCVVSKQDFCADIASSAGAGDLMVDFDNLWLVSSFSCSLRASLNAMQKYLDLKIRPHANCAFFVSSMQLQSWTKLT